MSLTSVTEEIFFLLSIVVKFSAHGQVLPKERKARSQHDSGNLHGTRRLLRIAAVPLKHALVCYCICYLPPTITRRICMNFRDTVGDMASVQTRQYEIDVRLKHWNQFSNLTE